MSEAFAPGSPQPVSVTFSEPVSHGIKVTCGHCGGDLFRLTEGRVSHLEFRCVEKCGTCQRQWLLTVQMSPAVDPRSERRRDFRKMRRTA